MTHGFRVRSSWFDFLFNHEIALDLVWLLRCQGLQAVDLQTHFSTDTFLPDKTNKAIWNAFIVCMVSKYVVTREIMRIGHGIDITGKQFEALSDYTGI